MIPNRNVLMPNALIRWDRTLIRLYKLGLLIGALGLLIEGLFELKLLVGPFVSPPSVPGQTKIIEHFVIQHIAFPVIGLLLVFAPLRLYHVFQSRLTGALLATLALLVTLPEAIVSRTDLFRPYPFQLHAPILEYVQMIRLGDLDLNVLQVQHLLFAHIILMGTIVGLAIHRATLLVRFAGPRTGEHLLAGL